MVPRVLAKYNTNLVLNLVTSLRLLRIRKTMTSPAVANAMFQIVELLVLLQQYHCTQLYTVWQNNLTVEHTSDPKLSLGQGKRNTTVYIRPRSRLLSVRVNESGARVEGVDVPTALRGGVS